MSGTKEGSVEALKTIYAKYGPDFFREVGARGGRAEVKKGFAMMTPEQRRKYGAKGGAISRRHKPRLTEERW